MNELALEKVSNIQLIHIGEDYSTYQITTEEGETYEVEITGIAQSIINSLGLALKETSFITNLK